MSSFPKPSRTGVSTAIWEQNGNEIHTQLLCATALMIEGWFIYEFTLQLRKPIPVTCRPFQMDSVIQSERRMIAQIAVNHTQTLSILLSSYTNIVLKFNYCIYAFNCHHARLCTDSKQSDHQNTFLYLSVCNNCNDHCYRASMLCNNGNDNSTQLFKTNQQTVNCWKQDSCTKTSQLFKDKSTVNCSTTVTQFSMSLANKPKWQLYKRNKGPVN